jgi:hypothetical protein
LKHIANLTYLDSGLIKKGYAGWKQLKDAGRKGIVEIVFSSIKRGLGGLGNFSKSLSSHFGNGSSFCNLSVFVNTYLYTVGIISWWDIDILDIFETVFWNFRRYFRRV